MTRCLIERGRKTYAPWPYLCESTNDIISLAGLSTACEQCSRGVRIGDAAPCTAWEVKLPVKRMHEEWILALRRAVTVLEIEKAAWGQTEELFVERVADDVVGLFGVVAQMGVSPISLAHAIHAEIQAQMHRARDRQLKRREMPE